MKRIHLLLFLLLLITTENFAQTDSLKKSKLDDQYEPNGNSVFNSNTIRGSKSGGRVSVPLKSAVKVTPFQLIRGNLLAEGELAIGSSYSFLFGAGYQFMPDLMLENFNASGPFGYDLAFGFKNPDYLNLDELLKGAEFLSGGAVIKLGMRTYVSSFPKVFLSRYYGQNFSVDGRAINDWYQNLSVTYNAMSYQLDTTQLFNGAKIEGASVIQVKSFFLMGGFGFCYARSGHVKTIHDFYFNFGLRYVRFTGFERVQYSLPLQLPPQYAYKSSGEQRNKILVPSIHVGYAFGFGF
jgi:hypothetical protein